ncbi:hypothetical protein E2C01_090138 [Portunus trituberculatus]|uniref:Uncharacterized protein n=1 Tax=Portunus trituberculatus TaxID=210409 RepID=A0A5B7JL22_PORTR|nr:hypothetical protein [Portunus trituberculatus]
MKTNIFFPLHRTDKYAVKFGQVDCIQQATPAALRHRGLAYDEYHVRPSNVVCQLIPRNIVLGKVKKNRMNVPYSTRHCRAIPHQDEWSLSYGPPGARLAVHESCFDQWCPGGLAGDGQVQLSLAGTVK